MTSKSSAPSSSPPNSAEAELNAGCVYLAANFACTIDYPSVRHDNALADHPAFASGVGIIPASIMTLWPAVVGIIEAVQSGVRINLRARRHCKHHIDWC
jgi:hypothetical protein